MKRLLFLLSLISLLLAACGSAATPSTEETLQSTNGTIQAPTPTETPEPPSPTPPPTATPVPTSTPEPTFTPTLEPTPKPQVYVVAQQIDVYESSNEPSRLGYIIPGKRFTIIGQEAGWVNIRMVPSEGSMSWDGWIQASETAYYPEGQIPPSPVPPTPTLVPDRTEFRRTGQYDWDGQIVLAPQYQVASTGQWAGKPTIGARVAAIDVEKGILTFDIGGQRTIQGRLAPGGRFQIEDSVRTGPTQLYGIVDASIYDFRVEDVVWIKANSQDELQGNLPGIVELLTISGLR